MAAARRRRWPWLLGVVAVFAAGAIWINAQLEPRRLAATVLGKAGESLQLELGFEGTPDYAFRPEPRLVLPGFYVASLDGATFLSARRAEISLPWSTITGDEPVITRIELDAPLIALPALKRWLDSRPPTPFKLPTLIKGIEVRDGAVHDAGWSVRALSFELPHLKSGDPAQLHAQGTFVIGKTKLPFELDALAATPGLASPLDLKLKLLSPKPAAIALVGHYQWADPIFTLQADKLALVAQSPIPSFEGKGKFERGNLAYLDLDVVLSRWPETWPKLPANLAASGEKLPVHVSYEGKPDFSEWLQIAASRDETQLQASLRVSELQRWLAADAASPLPPLYGRLKTPALEFDGVELQGVEVELSDGGSSESAP